MSRDIVAVNSQGFFDNDINNYVNRVKPMALVLTEHKQSDLRKLDVLDNYNLAAAYPATTGQRGSAIFVKKTTNYVRRGDLDSMARDRTFEVSNVEIPSRNVVITGQYRSPNSSKIDYSEKLDKLTRRVSASNQRHVIAGDFNIDSRTNSVAKRTLDNNGYKFNIRSSTHDKNKCLDNFATNFQPQPSKTRVMKSESLSDHRPIKMSLPLSSRKSTRK